MQDHTQPAHERADTQDREDRLLLTDPEVQDLYRKGYISRPLAEIYDIIADFNDGREAIPCC
jgi:hypothetical protein